jgi:hypothetical protein
MGASDPFGFSGSWLFNFNNNGGDDTDDDVELGNTNDISQDGQGKATTVVINSAPLSATFAAKNTSTLLGAVGVVGESHGGTGSVGVVGTSNYWGVAGIVTANPLLDTTDPNFDPTSFDHQPAGVFGAGDAVGVLGSGAIGVLGTGDTVAVRGINDSGNVGVHGGSTGGVGVLGTVVAAPTDVDNSKFSGTGIMGIGITRGGVFQAVPPQGSFPPPPNGIAPALANIELTPVTTMSSKVTPSKYPLNVPAPQLPQGNAGDMIALQVQGIAPPSDMQLWFCIRSGNIDKMVPSLWARVQLEIVASA